MRRMKQERILFSFRRCTRSFLAMNMTRWGRTSRRESINSSARRGLKAWCRVWRNSSLGFTILASSRHDDPWHICAPRFCGNQTDWLPQEIVFTSLFVCVYRVFGENAVCYNSDSLYVGNCAPVRKWWNWQTHHLEGVAPKGVGAQIPPPAPWR